MFDFTEYLNSNFISLITTGEISPQITCTNFICGNINYSSMSNTEKDKYDEFISYLDQLENFFNNAISDNIDILVLLRPIWCYAKLKYSNYYKASCTFNIPFNEFNYKKIKNFFHVLNQQNREKLIYKLSNTKINNFDYYFNKQINYELIDTNNINNIFIQNILLNSNKEELLDIKLLVVNCSQNGCNKINISKEKISYKLLCSIIDYYTGVIVSTFNEHNGNKTSYLIIGVGNNPDNVMETLNIDYTSVESDYFDNIYIHNGCIFTRTKENYFLFHSDCLISLKKILFDNCTISIRAISKNGREDIYNLKGKFLKCLKDKNVVYVDFKFNDPNSDNNCDWLIYKKASSIGLNSNFGSINFILDNLTFSFDFLGNNSSIKKFIHKDILNFRENLSELYDFDNFSLFLSSFDNSHIAYIDTLGAVYNNSTSVFYYSNRIDNIDNLSLSSCEGLFNLRNSLFSNLFVFIQPLYILLNSLNHYIGSLIDIFNYKILNNLTDSIIFWNKCNMLSGYTDNLEQNFYDNNTFKTDINFLKFSDLVNYISRKNMKFENIEKINDIFKKLVTRKINFPSVSITKLLSNNIFFNFIVEQRIYPTCFYSFSNNNNIFLCNGIVTNNILFDFHNFDKNYVIELFLDNDIYGAQLKLETSKRKYLLDGSSYKINLLLMDTIPKHKVTTNILLLGYKHKLNKNIDVHFSIASSKLSNIKESENLYYEYLFPRFDCAYHNKETIINPIHSISSGFERIYEISKNNVQEFDKLFFIDSKRINKYYLFLLFSIKNNDLYRKYLYDNKICLLNTFECGAHLAVNQHIMPEINLFTHFKSGLLMFNSIYLFFIFSFFTSPGLSSSISYKLFSNCFFRLNIDINYIID